MTDLDIDPKALRKFVADATERADQLRLLASPLHLTGNALGQFSAAQALTNGLNHQADQVHDRAIAAGKALAELAAAAGLAAELAEKTDEQFAQTMHQIGARLDKADSAIATAHGSGQAKS